MATATTDLRETQPASSVPLTTHVRTSKSGAVSATRMQTAQTAVRSPSMTLTSSSETAAPSPSAQPTLDDILQELERKGVMYTAMNLPQVSTMRITSQKRFPSEHPYKIHVGSLPEPSKEHVVAFLGPTPNVPNRAPRLNMYAGRSESNCRLLVSTQWDEIDMIEPFAEIWRRSGKGTPNSRNWWDSRRGMLKSLVYWYFLQEAAGRGGSFRFSEIMRRQYFVPALKKMGEDMPVATPAPSQALVNGESDDGVGAITATIGDMERYEREQEKIERRIREERTHEELDRVRAQKEREKRAVEAKKLEGKKKNERTAKRREKIAASMKRLRMFEVDAEAESRSDSNHLPAMMEVETPNVPKDNTSVTETAHTTVNKRKRSHDVEEVDERSEAAGQVHKRRSSTNTSQPSADSAISQPVMALTEARQGTASASGNEDVTMQNTDYQDLLRSFRQPTPTNTAEMNAQILRLAVAADRQAQITMKGLASSATATAPASVTAAPLKVGSAPWSPNSDWKSHLHLHRAQNPTSTVHACNIPSPPIYSPPEPLPPLTTIRNDQCVTALQKLFKVHKKLATRSEILEKEEQEAKKSYAEAVRKREEVQREMRENKVGMGVIARRLAEGRREVVQ